MLLNLRWGSLRLKIIAWFFVPCAAILLLVTLIVFVALQGHPSRGLVLALLLASLLVPAAVVSLGLKRIADPIVDLQHAAEEVARGNFDQNLSVNTGDEIEALADQFNQMAGQLEDLYTRSEQRVAARTRELATLNAVAGVVSGSLELDDILAGALDEVRQRLEMEVGVVLLAGAEGLRLRLQQGLSANAAAQLDAIGFQGGLAEQVLRNGEPAAVDIATYRSQAPAALGDFLAQNGAQALVMAPIQHKGHTHGVLVLVSQKLRDVQAQEIKLLCAIGQQIGMALENAALYEQARLEIDRRTQAETELRRLNTEIERRNRELTLLNRVISAITSEMPPEAVLEVVCRELVQAFGLLSSAAARLNPDGKSLTLVAEYRGLPGPSGLGVSIPVDENPATLYVLKNKTPLALADAQHDILLTPVHALMRQRQVASLLILPIIVKGRVIGTLGLDTQESREFSPEEIALAQQVTAAAAQVLERTQA